MMQRRGFTILEVLISLAIISLLTTIVVFTFAGHSNDKKLDAAVLNVKTLLEEARSNTLSGKNNSVYGVHFDASQIVLFVGTSYNPAATSNEVSALDSAVEISNINLVGGGNNIIFKRLTGATLEAGTITLRLVDDQSKTKIVSVNAVGTVD